VCLFVGSDSLKLSWVIQVVGRQVFACDLASMIAAWVTSGGTDSMLGAVEK
jgi:hypothetical protein